MMIADEDAALFGGAHRALTFVKPAVHQHSRYRTPSPIERLVEAGLLKCEQVTPRAPWEIRRSDLDAEPIRSIIDRLHRTGKLILQWGCTEDQLALFTENQGDDNARHHE